MQKNALSLNLNYSKAGLTFLLFCNLLVFCAIWVVNCGFMALVIVISLVIIGNLLFLRELRRLSKLKLDILFDKMSLIIWDNEKSSLWTIQNITTAGQLITMIRVVNEANKSFIITIIIDSITSKEYRALRSKILWIK